MMLLFASKYIQTMQLLLYHILISLHKLTRCKIPNKGSEQNKICCSNNLLHEFVIIFNAFIKPSLTILSDSVVLSFDVNRLLKNLKIHRLFHSTCERISSYIFKIHVQEKEKKSIASTIVMQASSKRGNSMILYIT